MSTIRNNIAANYIGTVWISIISILFVPIYLKVLGVEAFGLIGFFLAFRASLTILDLGLSTYSTREVARRVSIGWKKTKSLGSYVKTIELVYWAIALFLSFIFLIFALFFSEGWFKLDVLEPGVIKKSLYIFALTLGINWPVSFYRGVLRGLEKQIEYNYVSVFNSTFRGALSVFVIIFISPSVVAFLFAQLISSFVETILLRNMVWSSICKMPIYKASLVKFNIKELRTTWQALISVSILSILGILITQADKLILGLQLPLKQLGYYTVAATVAVSTSRLVDSIIVAIFPKFSSSYVQGKHEVMERIYKVSSDAVIFIFLPVLVSSIFFSRELLFFWTHSTSTAIVAGEVLSILIAAQLFTKLNQISSNFQFAAGNLKFLVRINILAFILYLPSLLIAISIFGAKGAAFSWLIVNFVINIYLSCKVRKTLSFSFASMQRFLKITLALIFVVLPCAFLKLINATLAIQLFSLVAIIALYYGFLFKKMWKNLSLGSSGDL